MPTGSATSETLPFAGQLDRLWDCVNEIGDRTGQIDELCQQWLEAVHGISQAPACIWLAERSQQVKLFSDIGFNSELEFDAARISELIPGWLQRSFSESQVIIQNCSTLGMPERTFVLIPLTSSTRSIGVLGILLDSNGDEDEVSDWEKPLARLTLLFSNTLQSMEQRHYAIDYRQAFRQFSLFTQAIHCETKLKSGTRKLVDQWQQFTQVDRVSLLCPRFSHLEPIAISGVARVDRRSQQMRQLALIGRYTQRSGQEVIYDRESREYPLPLRDQLVKYIEGSRSTFLKIIPLYSSNRAEADRSNKRRSRKSRPIGLLVLERFQNQSAPARLTEFQTDLVRQSELALAQLQDLDGIFLKSLRRPLGQASQAVRYSRFIRYCIAAILLGMTAWLMTCFSLPRKVMMSGTVVPEKTAQVYAPRSSVIRKVHVSSGQHVQAGQVLLELEDTLLRAEISQLEDLIAQQKTETQSFENELLQSGTGNRIERIQLQGEIAKAKLQLVAYQQELDVLEHEQNNLLVLAPIDGVVADFELQSKLDLKPVQIGEKLLEILDDQGRKTIEVLIPESQLGYLYEEIEGKSADQTISAEIRFLAEPDITYNGNLLRPGVERIVYRNQQPYLKCIVSLDDQSINTNLGAAVNAQVKCSPAPLGSLLFGDFFRALQAQFWWETF
ncbi:HlyD family efflux transporter periplasmic adaptor subunit [uncultured Rubinisphaera sp.]|uniref:efflux RND transporter periplasmic adaptor subunit n=1 Tax=uncultured Rubinisphaera sp. TaxID=1678686 RepID=UPI0030DBD42E